MHWVISDGTVYGIRYYTVAPPMFNGHWDDMMTWCEQTFGPTGSLWWESKHLAPEPHKRWYANNAKFWFHNQKDLDWFIIRWNHI
jgi:hypothetical protein